MRLTVFGATGGTGTEVIRQALARGHEVTAVVRDPGRMRVPPDPRLTVITAEATDSAAIKPALDGTEAVVSALGPRPGSPLNVLTDCMRSILAAMEATGTRRLVALSASGFFKEAGEGLVTGAIAKPILRVIFRARIPDTSQMEQLITASGTDWTIMRPAQLTNAARRPYKTYLDRYGGPRIGRADLADAILNTLTDRETIGHRVNLGY